MHGLSRSGFLRLSSLAFSLVRCLMLAGSVLIYPALSTLAHQFLQVISWLPMNKTAPVVLDAVFSTNSPPAVLNVVHPRPVTWHTMMSNLAASLSDATSSRKFKLVPFLDWIAQLEKLSLTLSVEEAKDIVSY